MGALVLWKVVREVFSTTGESRLVHRQANVRAALLKSAHPGSWAPINDI